MNCRSCDAGVRVPVRRAKLGERDGHAAVVLGVPMEECPVCGERYLEASVAARLHAIMDELLRRPEELASARWDGAPAA